MAPGITQGLTASALPCWAISSAHAIALLLLEEVELCSAKMSCVPEAAVILKETATLGLGLLLLDNPKVWRDEVGPVMEVWEIPSSRLAGASLAEYGLGTGG